LGALMPRAAIVECGGRETHRQQSHDARTEPVQADE
jgi:hypothetical protein